MVCHPHILTHVALPNSDADQHHVLERETVSKEMAAWEPSRLVLETKQFFHSEQGRVGTNDSAETEQRWWRSMLLAQELSSKVNEDMAERHQLSERHTRLISEIQGRESVFRRLARSTQRKRQGREGGTVGTALQEGYLNRFDDQEQVWKR